MALVHPHSCESVNSQIDWFSIPPSNTGVVEGHFEEFHPIATLSDGAPIEFAIKGSDFLDLAHSYLNIQACIVKTDGSKIDDGTEVAPVNLWLSSLFSQVDISLNGKLITPSTNTYAYRSYIETLLSFGNDAKESQLQNALWYQDTMSKMDAVTDENIGYKKRKELTKGSATVDMLGKIHADIFFQERYLLSNVEVKIRLVRSNDAFSIMSADAVNAKVSIKKASLFVRKIKLDPSVEVAAMKALERGTVKIPISRLETRVFSIPQGSLSNNQQNLVLGQLPSRMVIGFVDNDAMNGSKSKNPYNFKNYDINYVAVNINGKQHPAKAFTPDFENNLYARSYASLFIGKSQFFQDKGNGISYDQYKNGFTLFCLDFTPDMLDGDQFELINTGNMSLEVHFKKALPDTIKAICLLERSNMIEIDKTRNVITDFTV